MIAARAVARPAGSCRRPFVPPDGSGSFPPGNATFIARGTDMSIEFGLMMAYRLLALVVAIMMVVVTWREREWRPQFFAALIFIPFILRASGIK
jgi:hypothetical protein